MPDAHSSRGSTPGFLLIGVARIPNVYVGMMVHGDDWLTGPDASVRSHVVEALAERGDSIAMVSVSV